MIVALIDNGSLEPAAHRNLRAVAAALSERVGVAVEPVSWKHSDRIPSSQLSAFSLQPAVTLAPFVRAQVARGERDFLFVPFFISAQGAIGSALRSDLEKLSAELGGFSFAFTDGLAARGTLVRIVADRIGETIAAKKLVAPPIIVVDHGGPSRESAALRDSVAAAVGAVAATSMEGGHPPLLADELRRPDYADRDVVVALLFLAPGRHAGPEGDIVRIARASPARFHLTGLIGDHPAAVDVLAVALREAIDARLNPAGAGGRVS